MLKWLSIVCSIILSNSLQAQDSLKIISWEKALLSNPDSVVAIDASHLKWTEIPTDLYKFKRLRYLDLSRNKLTIVPSEFNQFSSLKWLSLERNKLTDGFSVLTSLAKLKHLDIGNNNFEVIPTSIADLTELEVFILWSNPVKELPVELMKCKKLESVDMRSILTNASFQLMWEERMPNVKWHFDSPCNCID